MVGILPVNTEIVTGPSSIKGGCVCTWAVWMYMGFTHRAFIDDWHTSNCLLD